MNVTNTLNADINAVVDSTQAKVYDNNVISGFDSSVAQGFISLALINGFNPITLPQTTCYQLYIKNTSESNSIAINMTTPATGGSQAVGTLYPGDIFILWQNPLNKNTLAGFTALNLAGVGPNVTCDLFIGG